MKLPRTKNLRFGQLVCDAIGERINKGNFYTTPSVTDILYGIPDSELEKLLTKYLEENK